MAGIPQNFQAISNVLPTYEFIDLASGTGIITFYAGYCSTKGVTLSYVLSDNTFYSDAVFLSSASFSDSSYVKKLDIDFDVLLNRPLVIQGKTVVNVPLGLNPSSGTLTYYVNVKLRKWDGTTETEIISTDSQEISSATAKTYTMRSMVLNIPLTTFKKGEYMRLTIEGYGKFTAGAGYIELGCDPMNRSVTWDTSAAVPSRLTFQCPVRLNL